MPVSCTGPVWSGRTRTGAAGHRHNTAIVRLVEAAEADLMRERGVEGYFGAAPRVRYEVDFASPLWFGQEVTTTLVVERIGTTSMTFRFEVWGEKTDRHPRALSASGRFTVVYVPLGDGRASTPWPPEWIAALTVIPTDVETGGRGPRHP